MAEKPVVKFSLRSSIIGHEQDVRAVAPLYFPEGSFVSGSRDITAKIWKPNDEDGGFSEGLVFGGHSNFISSVCVMPPNEQYPHGIIFTGSNDHLILAYTLDSPQPKFKLEGHTDTVCALAAGKYGSVISGSWDKTARVWLGEKCVLTLQEHSAAVWSVAIMPTGGFMLTGSADKTIKLWKTGKVEKTFTGHEDCVRGLSVLNEQEFLSCSNDCTVRRWLINGDCLGIYYGHSNFVYAVACLSNGTDFVSCGEDRTLRVWRDGEIAQTIAHPTQSVWTVCVLQNGDIVTGASDGVVRIFTQSRDRTANAVELSAFEDSVAGSSIPAQVGDIKTDDLPGPEALLNPGKRDGQTLMIRRQNNIEAHQWSMSDSRWIKIGDVVGGSGGNESSSSGRATYEGKDYDYVFDVELGEGMPALKLPYNRAEDPWMAAHNFLEKNGMSQLFVDQVAHFIQQQAGDIIIGPGSNVSDPFTGGGRYIPGGSVSSRSSGQSGDPLTGANRYVPPHLSQSQEPQPSALTDPFTGVSRYQPGTTSASSASESSVSYFPESSYIKYDGINIQGVLGKLVEFNNQSLDESRFIETDIKQIRSLIDDGQTNITAHQFDILWKMMQWPVGVLFPVLDILRHAISLPAVNQHFCNAKDGLQFLDYCNALLASGAVPKNRLLVLRTLCNAFQQSDGENLLLNNSERLLTQLTKLGDFEDKHAQIAASSLVLNFAVGFAKKSKPEEKNRCLVVVREMSSSQTNLQPEAIFRLLVTVGTVVAGDPNGVELAKSLRLTELVCRGMNSDLQKVKDCARMLAKKLT